MRHAALSGKLKELQGKIAEFNSKFPKLIDVAKGDPGFVGHVEGMIETLKVPLDMILQSINTHLGK